METKEQSIERKQKRYNSYLKAITFVFLITMLIVISLLVYYYIVNNNHADLLDGEYHFGYCAVSIILLLLGTAIAVAFSGKEYSKNTEAKANEVHSRGIAITGLFFSHMILVCIFVGFDGGAQTSCMSNILLLDAVFGCFFAEKIPIKITATLMCFVAYIFVLFFYSENSALSINFQKDFVEGTVGKIPYVLTAVFVVGTHAVVYLSQREKKTLSESENTTEFTNTGKKAVSEMTEIPTEGKKASGDGDNYHFYGSVGDLYVQKDNERALQGRKVEITYDYEDIQKLVSEINKYDQFLESEFGIDNAKKLRGYISDLPKSTTSSKDRDKANKALSCIRDLCINAGGGIVASGVLKILEKIIK